MIFGTSRSVDETRAGPYRTAPSILGFNRLFRFLCSSSSVRCCFLYPPSTACACPITKLVHQGLTKPPNSRGNPPATQVGRWVVLRDVFKGFGFFGDHVGQHRVRLHRAHGLMQMTLRHYQALRSLVSPIRRVSFACDRWPGPGCL